MGKTKAKVFCQNVLKRCRRLGWKTGMFPGGRVKVDTPDGSVTFPLLGEFKDLKKRFEKQWVDGSPDKFLVYLKESEEDLRMSL